MRPAELHQRVHPVRECRACRPGEGVDSGGAVVAGPGPGVGGRRLVEWASAVRPGYLEGLLAHLIASEKPAGITAVETFEQAGATGTGWAPHGLKITGVDGQAVFLSLARTSALVNDSDDQQTVFNPADLAPNVA